MSKQKPINVTVSPESAQDVPTQDAHFQATVKQILPILEQAGYDHFLLTVYDSSTGKGLYSTALSGVKTKDDVAGLLAKAQRVCGEFIRHKLNLR